MVAAIIVVIYIVCGALAYAITFADFQRSFPTLAGRDYQGDVRRGVMVGLLGPVGLLIAFLASDFAAHGLKWR